MSAGSETSRVLSNHLRFLVKLLEGRWSEVSSGNLQPSSICVGIDINISKDLARQFFGDGDFKIFGIDGSMAQEEYMEMLLFYVCSLGYYGRMKVGRSGIEVDTSGAEREEALALTGSVPLWMEDLSNVNPEAASASEDFEVTRSIESVSYALMRLSELTLACKAVQESDAKVIFIDGLLSSIYGPLMRDLRLLIRSRSVLEGFDTPHGKISKADLVLSGNLGPYPNFSPNRDVFSTYNMVRYLLSIPTDTWISLNDLTMKFHNFSEAYGGLTRLNNRLNSALLEYDGDGKRIRVKSAARGFWNRIWWATSKLVTRIFEESKEYPLLLGENRWITILDLSALNLFTLFNFLGQAIKKKILVIGIAKDTSATDFVRSLLPVLLHTKGAAKGSLGIPRLHSDKAFLTMYSTINHQKLPTPWRTVEHDYAFSSALSDIKDGKLIIRPARRIIGSEQVFVKSYFQSRSSTIDPSMRTPVFCYDRPVYPEQDKELIKELKARKHGHSFQFEPILDSNGSSRIGNLALHLLSLSDNPNIIEESGHNHLLFLADKHVKVVSKQAAQMLKSIASLGLEGVVSKYKAYFVAKKFREMRASIEKLREMRG
nr:hypothetical protein [Candidatus Njordarchaeota archaeon]